MYTEYKNLNETPVVGYYIYNIKLEFSLNLKV